MARPALPKGEKTRQNIIRTALRLVAKRGFSETSFQMIADALGLSQSAVLYHYKTKYALFEDTIKTIVRHNHETVNALTRMTDNAGQRLVKHCLGNVLWAHRYRADGQVLILLYYFACFERKFTSLFTQMMERGRERLMVHLLAGEREGLFRLPSGPATAAETLQDALFGAMLHAISAPEGSVPRGELEGKWRQVVAAHTGWTDPRPSLVTLPSPREGRVGGGE
ncbi:MAG: TetR/AcrR family transcriptional regulator [Elusimicrobia bacterium]|nr:TetR/AcrR family transcriptional regulator [Elusimicrobiota bacterium]